MRLSLLVLELEDDIDISRGDMIVKTTNQPQNSQEIDAMICWMGENPMQLNGKYSIKHTTRSGRAIIKEIVYVVDLELKIETKEKTPWRKMTLRELKSRPLPHSFLILTEPIEIQVHSF